LFEKIKAKKRAAAGTAALFYTTKACRKMKGERRSKKIIFPRKNNAIRGCGKTLRWFYPWYMTFFLDCRPV
jgi:hypothetical protein